MVNKVLLSHKSGGNGDYFSFELAEPHFSNKNLIEVEGTDDFLYKQLHQYTHWYLLHSYCRSSTCTTKIRNWIRDIITNCLLESQRDTSDDVKYVYIKFLPPIDNANN